MIRRNRVAPTVSVVVPAKNEAANLREVLPRLPAVHEVILVDGNSVDDTISAARETMPDVRVVRQTRKGKGNALACGFLAATGDIIVMFDADGSADPDEIPLFVQALIDGADFAKGSRFAVGGGSEDITLLRSMGNRGLNFVANRAFGTKFTDLCYGYNAFWRDLVGVLDLPDIDATVPENAMLWGDGLRSRPSSTAGLRPPASPPPKWPAPSCPAFTASVTSAPSPTALASFAPSPPSTDAHGKVVMRPSPRSSRRMPITIPARTSSSENKAR